MFHWETQWFRTRAIQLSNGLHLMCVPCASIEAKSNENNFLSVIYLISFRENPERNSLEIIRQKPKHDQMTPNRFGLTIFFFSIICLFVHYFSFHSNSFYLFAQVHGKYDIKCYFVCGWAIVTFQAVVKITALRHDSIAIMYRCVLNGLSF